ncbi:MAG: hypothetical protein IT448_09665 [Phycisphaerales bacterium]|nr:hypothetical protein [Phycisphaerales bacterium]
MSTLGQRSFVQGQILEMDRLLELAGNHPLMAPGLRQRKQELEQELRTLPQAGKQPRTVLFFTGQPVMGSRGIDAEFAAKVLEPFLEMVKTQYAATKHGNVGARGPRRDEGEAKLLLTGLPRGSFGLELSQPDPQDLFAGEHLADVLVRLTEVIKSAGESDEGFAVAMTEASPRVLHRLKDFFKVVADNQADVRVVSGDLECRLNHGQVAQAFERVSGTKTREQDAEKQGIFRGVTLDSRRFDFHADDGEPITGRVGDDVSDGALEEMPALTNQHCTARLKETIIETRSGATRTRYELLQLVGQQPAQ